MNHFRSLRRWLLLGGLAVVALGSSPQILRAVNVFRSVGTQPGGQTLVPTGQELRPAGKDVTFPGRPVAAALSPNGATLAVLNSTGLLLLDSPKGARPPRLRQ